MSCGHCAGAVEEAVHTADPQAQVHVELASGQVVLQCEQPRQVLVAAIVGAGYATQ